METSVVDVAQAVEGFSFYDLFMRADWVVKGVMGILAFMSIWSWAIAVDKSLQMRGLHGKSKVFEREFWSGRPLDALADQFAKNPRDPFSHTFAAGLREWKGTAPGGRVAKAAGAEASRQLNNAETGLGILATIASAAPFVGLFGTVWGIMNAFRAIAAEQNTNLAVVAPGIAEALFATALGLLAAIPAVIFFNALSANIGKYGARLDGFVDELSALADREGK
ncbi:protein TolQ [Maricaulis sp.]|uniref:protein TolQ n=1 Tax=Maricaulis sp. TaxID=1486257 RepID=UPI001AFEB2DB|nr:protein TolQ [Maricaulis sp.]MBO6796560.1 protein TolQ [Maricaulis sp.]